VVSNINAPFPCLVSAQEVMLQNVDKVVARGEKLQVLQERTEDLQASAEAFRKHVSRR
jgi:hypothetical protein